MSFMRRLEMKLDMILEHQADELNLLRQLVANTVTGSTDINDVLPQPARSVEEFEELERTLDTTESMKKLVTNTSGF